jgi:hypothetical protein
MLQLATTQLGAYAHAVAQGDGAFKHAVHVDLDVLAAAERAAHVQARRVGQAHALLHQGDGQAALVHAFEFGQLHRAVDAGDLGGIGDLVGHDGHTVPTANFTMSVR